MTKLFSSLTLALLTFSTFSQTYNFNVLDSIRDETMEDNYSSYYYYFDVWGEEIDGDKYAFLSSMQGLHVYRIINEKFEYIDFKEAKEISSIVAHRDYFVHNNHLYAVCDEGNSSLEIYDLNYLPDSVHKVYDDNSEVARAHNVWVDTSSNVLYAMGDWGMKYFDISNPAVPVFEGGWYDEYVHDMYARNDTIFAFLPFTGLHVFKYNQGNLATIAEMYTYVDQGICHSGWLSENGNYLYFADESRGKRMKAYDVSGVNIYSPRLLGLFGLTGNESIAHNLMQEGDFIYVAYYRDGFKVYSTENSVNPVLVAQYETYHPFSLNDKFDGAWGVYKFKDSPYVLFSDQHNGLFLMEFQKENTASTSEQPLVVDFKFHQDELHINFEGGASAVLNIYDASGCLVGTYNLTRNSYFSQNLSFLESGLYFYQVESGNNTASGKFVK